MDKDLERAPNAPQPDIDSSSSKPLSVAAASSIHGMKSPSDFKSYPTAADYRQIASLLVVAQVAAGLYLIFAHWGDKQFWTESTTAQVLKLTVCAAITQWGLLALKRVLGHTYWWIIILAFVPVVNGIIVGVMYYFVP